MMKRLQDKLNRIEVNDMMLRQKLEDLDSKIDLVNDSVTSNAEANRNMKLVSGISMVSSSINVGSNGIGATSGTLSSMGLSKIEEEPEEEENEESAESSSRDSMQKQDVNEEGMSPSESFTDSLT